MVLRYASKHSSERGNSTGSTPESIPPRRPLAGMPGSLCESGDGQLSSRKTRAPTGKCHESLRAKPVARQQQRRRATSIGRQSTLGSQLTLLQTDTLVGEFTRSHSRRESIANHNDARVRSDPCKVLGQILSRSLVLTANHSRAFTILSGKQTQTNPSAPGNRER